MPNHLLYQAPQQQIADPDTGIVTREWYLWFMDVLQALTSAGDVFGPGSSVNNAIVLWDGTSGTQIKVATGTGLVQAASGVYGTTPNTAASKLVGRGSASGAGPWEEISLGTGLTMTATTLSANVSVDYVVMSDGANPPSPMDDGAGNFLYMNYTP